MATVIETAQCYPKPPPKWFGEDLPAPPADHERCPGGQTIKGVMGGWVCPCPCHRKTALIDGQDLGGAKGNRHVNLRPTERHNDGRIDGE